MQCTCWSCILVSEARVIVCGTEMVTCVLPFAILPVIILTGWQGCPAEACQCLEGVVVYAVHPARVDLDPCLQCAACSLQQKAHDDAHQTQPTTMRVLSSSLAPQRQVSAGHT